jgi:hypothetical protein
MHMWVTWIASISITIVISKGRWRTNEIDSCPNAILKARGHDVLNNDHGNEEEAKEDVCIQPGNVAGIWQIGSDHKLQEGDETCIQASIHHIAKGALGMQPQPTPLSTLTAMSVSKTVNVTCMRASNTVVVSSPSIA